MRSKLISCAMLVVVLLLGLALTRASPAPIPHPTSHPTSSSDSTPFSISEYTVDNEGLWTDTEVPLSDASLEAIRRATPATQEDIEAWNAEAEPGMQVHAIMAEMEEENDVENDADSDAETDADADADAEPQADTDTRVDADADTDTDAETEQDISEPIHDDLEITHGSHGRMLLIPHSSHLHMRRVIMLLKRLITQLKARSSLARITLKMKIEPVITPTPTPTPSSRRPAPTLGIRHRPRPVAIRLIPSRSDMRTRRLLARCSMLLRMAVQRLRKMRQMMIWEKMQRLREMRHRLPGRGVILFRSNNITATGPRFSQTTMNRFEIEGGKNGTVTIIAPRINSTLAHSIIVINRGTIVLLNRSRNNTLALTPPQPHSSHRRRFLLPFQRHHVMTANENHIEPNQQHEAQV